MVAGLLESASPRPRTSPFGVDAYPDLSTKGLRCCTQSRRIMPLVDGNKGLSWLATAVLLDLNGIDVAIASNDVIYELVVDVAAEDRSISEIAIQLQTILNYRRSTDIARTRLWAMAQANYATCQMRSNHNMPNAPTVPRRSPDKTGPFTQLAYWCGRPSTCPLLPKASLCGVPTSSWKSTESCELAFFPWMVSNPRWTSSRTAKDPIPDTAGSFPARPTPTILSYVGQPTTIVNSTTGINASSTVRSTAGTARSFCLTMPAPPGPAGTSSTPGQRSGLDPRFTPKPMRSLSRRSNSLMTAFLSRNHNVALPPHDEYRQQERASGQATACRTGVRRIQPSGQGGPPTLPRVTYATGGAVATRSGRACIARGVDSTDRAIATRGGTRSKCLVSALIGAFRPFE